MQADLIDANQGWGYHVPASPWRIELLDFEMVVFAHHHVLDHLEVHLHAVALVADPHHLHAGMRLPFALEGLDEFPAGGELHPVAYAVEKIFVAALIHSNDHDGGAVRALARAFRRV